MKRMLIVFLTLTCLTALFTPAFAAVQCKLPQELPGAKEDVAVHDVLILGSGPEGSTASDAQVQDVPVGETPFGPDADGKYATMGDLFQAWGGYEGYPDYVCGVWSADGGMTNMMVAVTDNEAGEKGREEILSLLKDPATVIFTTQKYRYRELQQVMDEITAQMGADSPIVSCGVYERENAVHVTVNENHQAAEAAIANLTTQYGDLVLVEAGEMVFSTLLADGPLDDRPAVELLAAKPSVGTYLPVILVLTLLSMAALRLVVKRPARVTNTGRVVAEGRPSRAQVEAALTERTETPPDRVEQELNRKL